MCGRDTLIRLYENLADCFGWFGLRAVELRNRMMRLGGGGGMSGRCPAMSCWGGIRAARGIVRRRLMWWRSWGARGFRRRGRTGGIRACRCAWCGSARTNRRSRWRGRTGVTKLRWLHQVSVTARMNLPESGGCGDGFRRRGGRRGDRSQGQDSGTAGGGGGHGRRTAGRRRTDAGGDSGDADHRWLGRPGAGAVAGGVLGGDDAGGCSGGGARGRRRTGATFQSFGGGRFVRGVGTYVSGTGGAGVGGQAASAIPTGDEAEGADEVRERGAEERQRARECCRGAMAS